MNFGVGRRMLGALVLLFPAAVAMAGDAGRVAYFHVDGFKANGYSLRIVGSVVRYKSGPSYKESSLPWRRVKVAEKELQRFMERAAALGVFDWQPEYTCPTTLDGVEWNLDLSWKERKVSSRGSNKFPARFDDFEAQIAGLIHQPFGISISSWECRE